LKQHGGSTLFREKGIVIKEKIMANVLNLCLFRGEDQVKLWGQRQIGAQEFSHSSLECNGGRFPGKCNAFGKGKRGVLA
jgi:hypothetical protein